MSCVCSCYHPAMPCCIVTFLWRQINKYAFSGGGATVEEHRAKGANLEVGEGGGGGGGGGGGYCTLGC